MSKISALTEGTSIVATDLFRFVDVSDTTMAASGTNKKATATNVSAGLLALANLYYGSNTIAQRNGTNPQEFRLYNTYTDASNYERGFIGMRSNVLTIGTEASGTGTARNLSLIADKVFLRDLTYEYLPYITANQGPDLINTYGKAVLTSSEAGNIVNVLLADDFWSFKSDGWLRAGGTTSSFPALKQSSATLQIRLADDSAFAPIQGKLTTDTNATTGTITADKYLILYDSAGTAYRVPCVAD